MYHTVTPTSGYSFHTLTVGYGENTADVAKVSDTEYTFVMPAGAVMVTATFTANSGGYVPPSNTTTTTKNPDGSTTKTTTDKKTGETTVVTTYPDGTKLVTGIPKDGTATTEVTLPKGKDSATVTIPTKTPPAATDVPVIVHPDGTRELLRFSVGTKESIRLTLTGDAVIAFQTSIKTFPDIEAGTWYSDAAVSKTMSESCNASLFLRKSLHVSEFAQRRRLFGRRLCAFSTKSIIVCEGHSASEERRMPFLLFFPSKYCLLFCQLYS